MADSESGSTSEDEDSPCQPAFNGGAGRGCQPEPEPAGAAATSAADAWRPTLAIGGEAVEFAVAGFGPQAARLGPTAASAAEPLLANPAELSGKVAVVRRSWGADNCSFTKQARRTQAAGAVAVILVTADDGDGDVAPYSFQGDGDLADITIPCICVGQADGCCWAAVAAA